jgi:hypothetical protein
MILITVASVGYLGNWSASMHGRVICASVRLPLVAAAKVLLAEGFAPETEIAMKHEGSTIVAMQGKIGTLALTDEAATPEGPSPPQTGSQGGDLAAEGGTLPETDSAVPEPLARHADASIDGGGDGGDAFGRFSTTLRAGCWPASLGRVTVHETPEPPT